MHRWLIVLALWLGTAAPAATITVGENPLTRTDNAFSVANYVRFLDRWERFRQDCYHRYASLTYVSVAITISGRIEPGDAAAFSAIGERHAGDEDFGCPDAVVLLDSPGGDLREAIALGREIARFGFATVVGPQAECLSACIFLLAGGAYQGGYPEHMVVFSGARIGIHQPQFDPTDRERLILGRIPEDERIDGSFALAGEEWKNITRYVVDERRNAYLMRRLLASPQARDQFDYFDTFEEFYFAGITLIDSGHTALSEAERAALEQRDTTDYLTADLARLVCALPPIREGALADFSDSYATQFGPGWVVGFDAFDTFCYARGDNGVISSCHFDVSLMWTVDGRMPAWIEQWGVGAMGFYPRGMFDLTWGVTDPPTPAESAEIAAFFHDRATGLTLCERHEAVFFANELDAFPRHMRLSPDCNTPTRLCE